MLVDSLATRRLISSLHCHSRIVFIVLFQIHIKDIPLRGAKVQLNLKRTNIFEKKLEKVVVIPLF
jgi:hypothetical protein